MILEPEEGATIRNRDRFQVEVSIGEFERGRAQGYHYWVSVAESTDGKLNGIHWPKFYIKKDLYRSWVYDGGTNNLPEPDEKQILETGDRPRRDPVSLRESG